MKMLKNLFALVLTVALSLSCIGEAKAAGNDDYTYTITVYAGNRGTLSKDAVSVVSENDYVLTASEDKIVISKLFAGDVVSVYPQSGVSVTEDKYYVQGIRLSGRDNDEDELEDTVFTVTEDADYVVVYGISGNQVAYTVNYVDQDGNELAASDTFYGNIGDKPVVAYKYIDGYVPEVFGFTKTLSEDASENVFTFVYDEAPTPSVIIQQIPGGAGNAGGGNAGTGNAGTGNEGAANTDVNADDATTENQGDGTTTPDEPVVDLDEQETPGANIDLDGSNAGLVGSIAIGAVAVIGLFALILVMMKKRKQQ